MEEEARQKEEGERLKQERDKHFQKEEAERNERKKVIYTNLHQHTSMLFSIAVKGPLSSPPSSASRRS